ncbi:MAG: hypothetical protein KZQ99_18070 [Candidatus Thiodiazotropha sp. (ex Dulcina madagascariensis)]|nr:hypothetical protein [Candidatus Thiodiazotropha sp. (ex Dulcina madagascariensis)]
MDQLRDFADDRLINGCIYCGGVAETRDHVPSRILLDPPYPENLPVVGACHSCNQGFSKDEQYLVCLLESVLIGSTDPEKIRRASVSRAMKRSPALRSRIEATKSIYGEQIVFNPEENRVRNVMLKLARGHAAFELSQPCRCEPDHYWCGSLESLNEEQREGFSAAHIQKLYGEVGSRNIQRMFAAEVTLQSDISEQNTLQVVVNDWVEVQEGCYRYLAIDDISGVIIRIVIFDYLACEVGWQVNA